MKLDEEDDYGQLINSHSMFQYLHQHCGQSGKTSGDTKYEVQQNDPLFTILLLFHHSYVSHIQCYYKLNYMPWWR